MVSTQINHPTIEGEDIIFLKYYEQSFVLDIEDKAQVTVTCESVEKWNELFGTNFDMGKSNKLVCAIATLLEREGKQLEAIYKEMENEE